MKTYTPYWLITLSLMFLANVSLAADYFWIGGSGNWEDITHWATTSGGNVTHTQTPTANDDVFFDTNSFTAPNQTVTINSNVAFSRTLSFADATFTPTFSAGNNVVLSVFGGLLLSDDMIFNFEGDMVFGADTAGHIIDLSGHNAGANTTFDGAGAWVVASDLIMTDDLTIRSGSVSFMNSQISCEYFYSRGVTPRSIEFNNSVLTISGTTILIRPDVSEENIYSSRINVQNLNWTSTNSEVHVTSENAQIIIQGNGTITFETLSTINENGTFHLINIDQLSDIRFSRNLDLTKDAFINADITVETLTLYGSHKYTFESLKSVEISTLDANASCLGSIIIGSSISGNASVWNATQPISGEYLTLSDINVNSNNATANNSVDLGNNNGWTINNKTSETLYWIGGTGNWDDGNHWSLTSGGVASGCVPTAVDDVFFDMNSFNAPGQSVTVNIPNALCRTMIWENITNTPTLDGPEEHSLLIHGSLRFDPSMSHDFLGDYFFVSNTLNNNITSSGQLFNKNIYFNNVLGGWVLEDDLFVNLSIRLVAGSFNTQSQSVECFLFNSDYTTPRELSLGSSVINLVRRDNSFYHFWLESENLNFNAGTSTIIFNDIIGECVSRGNQALTYHNIEFRGTRSTLNSVSPAAIRHTFNKVSFRRDGQITGNNVMDTLVLKNGFSYSIGPFSEQDIDVLEWDDICNGLIGLSTFSNESTIRLGTTQELVGFNISRIHFDNSPPIEAIESVDGGFNMGVNFAPATGRDLYWIGGEGEWDDSANWSSTSGGPGGECIPTIIDNVFFDINSFDTNNDLVQNTNGNSGFCRNFTFSAPDHTNRLVLTDLQVSGNIDMQGMWTMPVTVMTGSTAIQTIRSSGSAFSGLEITGTSNVAQLDDLTILNLFIFFGSSFYNSNDFNITANNFNIFNSFSDTPTIDFGNSVITIAGNLFGVFYPFIISGNETSPNSNLDDATYLLTSNSTGLNISTSGVMLGHVEFTNSDGSATILSNFSDQPSFSSIAFRGDGNAIGASGFSTDTLVLSAGKTYIFESDVDYMINEYLNARGNNCLPLSWQSSQSSQGINLTMDININIDMDFVEMSGIDAICCNSYFAGNNSTNIANSNDGWIFGDPNNTAEDEGFFGADIIVCDNNDVVLMPFNDDQISSILWNDGSTNISFTASATQEISALVTFTNNCEIRDTVDVRFETSFSIDFGADTTLCEGSSLLLNPNIPNANYEWQDMSSNATFLVESEGTYSVQVDLGSCNATDTINVSFQVSPTPPLPMTEVGCEGETITLSANIGTPADYLWQDGNTASTRMINNAGEYIVTITEDNCSIIDTSIVSFNPIPMIDALMDETICDRDTFVVGPTPENGTEYFWNGELSTAIIEAIEPGRYLLEAINEFNCSVRDSFVLETLELPDVDLGDDMTICEGANIDIGTMNTFASYSWSTGQIQPIINVDQSDQYILSVTDEGCTNSDTINITIQQPAMVDLGIDRSFCEGDSITLDAGNTADTFLWQDGSSESTFTAKAAGLYTVMLDLNGCISSESVILSVDPRPFFDLGSNQDLCVGENTTLIVPTDPTWDIVWNTGATTDMIVVDQTGNFSATASLNNCSFTDDVNITFHDIPSVNLGPDQEKCDQVALTLEIRDLDVNVLWEDGSTNPVRTIQSDGMYSVEVESSQGCIGRDTITITDISCTIFNIYFPTAFSPNGDNINDIYEVGLPDGISIASYLFSIYDRWGNLLFQSDNPGIGWDGLVNSQFVKTGTFIAVVDISYSDDFNTDISRTVSSEFVLFR